MVLENGEIESASLSEDEMPPMADCSDIEIEEPVHDNLLDTKRVLSIYSLRMILMWSNVNIFFTQYAM